MKKTKSRYVSVIVSLSFLLGGFSLSAGQVISAQDANSKKPTKAKESTKEQKLAPDMVPVDPRYGKSEENEEALKKAQEKRAAEGPIENVSAITSDQLVNKPQDYLNKNVKFTAPFFAFSNLALDYKPAFRSSRTYLSFLVLHNTGHTPFSEIKLAMLIPKEKDPQTKMLQTLKEGDVIEITGHVFACSLDEPWLDVLQLKKIASAKKVEGSEDKTADEKESSEDQPSEK